MPVRTAVGAPKERRARELAASNSGENGFGARGPNRLHSFAGEAERSPERVGSDERSSVEAVVRTGIEQVALQAQLVDAPRAEAQVRPAREVGRLELTCWRSDALCASRCNR